MILMNIGLSKMIKKNLIVLRLQVRLLEIVIREDGWLGTPQERILVVMMTKLAILNCLKDADQVRITKMMYNIQTAILLPETQETIQTAKPFDQVLQGIVK